MGHLSVETHYERSARRARMIELLGGGQCRNRSPIGAGLVDERVYCG